MLTPLQPLPPMQRLGWLQHFSSLKCKTGHTSQVTGHFLKNRRYAIATETVRVESKERRARRDGSSEPVTYTGKDLLVRIQDEQGNWHRFLSNPPLLQHSKTPKHPLIHDFMFLVKHFEIPEIPDAAALQPKLFREMKQRLKALES